MPELPPIKVKVDFDGSALEEGAVQLELFGEEVKRMGDEGGKAMETLGNDVERESEKVVENLDNVGGSAKKNKGEMMAFGDAAGMVVPALIGLAVALGFLLLPLAAYAVGIAAAVTLGSVLLGSFAAIGAGVVALVSHYENWTAAAVDVTTAQQAVRTATLAHEQAIVALDNATTAYNRQHTAVTLLQLQIAQQKAADSANALALAQKQLNDAQTGSLNPLQQLTSDLDELGKTMADKAMPAATAILQWLDSLIPRVETVGTELLQWFGTRLPAALPLLTTLFQDFLDKVVELGEKLGPVFDNLIAHPETFELAFKKTFGGAVDAIVALVGYLNRLSDWWGVHGPELEKIATQTWNTIITIIVVLIGWLGQLSLWFNMLEQAFAPAWALIMQGFQQAVPLIGLAVAAFQALNPVLQLIQAHSQLLVPLLQGIGLLLAFMAASAILTIAVVAALALGIAGLIEVLVQLSIWFNQIVNAITSGIGAAFSWLGSQIEKLTGDIGGLIGALGSLFDRLQRLGSINLQIPSLPSIPGFVAGGFAPAGQAFYSGEQGIELGYAVPGGGVVITPIANPGSVSNRQNNTYNIQGVNPDVIAMAIDRRVGRMFR